MDEETILEENKYLGATKFLLFLFSIAMILISIIIFIIQLIIRYQRNLPLFSSEPILPIIVLVIGIFAFFSAETEKRIIWRVMYFGSFFVCLSLGTIYNLRIGQYLIKGDMGYILSIIIFGITLGIIVLFIFRGSIKEKFGLLCREPRSPK
jgi:hypothetical protein